MSRRSRRRPLVTRDRTFGVRALARTPPRTRCALAATLVLLACTACTPPPDRDRVIVLGLDGADPQTVDLLVSEGKLPNSSRGCGSTGPSGGSKAAGRS